MAHAQRKPAVTEVIEPEGIVLTLSMEEAKTLYILGHHIGGDSEKSRRGHIDSITGALRESGVYRPLTYDFSGDLHLNQSIYFNEEQGLGL